MAVRFLSLALAFTLLPSRGEEAPSRTRIQLEADGKAIATNPEGRVPYGAVQTKFIITPRPGLVHYRLAGHETEWKEHSGDMFFIVRFLNAGGDQIAQHSFLTKGKSAGWNGAPETSDLTSRHEKLVVPAGTSQLVIAISSAGPATSVGTFGIANVHAYSRNQAGVSRELIGNGAAWGKGGTRPSMASTVTGADGYTVYLLEDRDDTGHADWRTMPDDASRVTGGETLHIEWGELFCTGAGGSFEAHYDRLPPGDYRFEVEAFDYSGQAPGEITSLTLHVAGPWWKNPWYWTATLLAVAAGSAWIVRHLVRKRIQLHLREARMIAEERLRIARDLHDDLGARISHIALLGAHAMGTAPDDETRRSFGEIAGMSRELASSLSESVWMLNSKNDQLESLVDYLCRMVSGLCRPLEIRCRIDAAPMPSNFPVSSELRHHVTLAVKEAANNALKHSGCAQIQLAISLKPDALHIRVTDDGKGIDEAGQGNGLFNIRQRMEQLGGSASLSPAAQGGTEVHLRVPLTSGT